MSATAAIHPTDETLRSHSLGKLDPASAESVQKHLEGCSACRRRLAEMSPDGALGPPRDALGGQPGSTGPCVSSSLDGLSMLDGGESVKTPPPKDSLPPGLVDHPDYEVIRELGQGGMGTVYLAKNRLMARLEVLKIVSKDRIHWPGALERFLIEIRNAARLHHTNIVTAFSAMRIGESIVFAMEYVDGLDLSKLVKAKGPLPVANACNYVHQTALGLQHASEMGMVHRDIKPGNLMLTRQGSRAVIKVLDFGLAKVKSEGAVDGGLTYEGQLLGTPEFVSPEQISDARRADIRADIYSLGCTLYYLLTAAPPFHANSLYEILQAHHSMDAFPLNLARPEVPVELAALVARMMAKEPARRFQTPKDVADSLLPFFKKGMAEVARPSAEMSLLGVVEEDRASTRSISVPAQNAPQTPPPTATTPATPREEPAWESLIKFKEPEPLATPAPAVSDSARPRRWAWPSVSVGGLLLALLIACALVLRTAKFNVRLASFDDSLAVKAQGDERSARTETQDKQSSERPTDMPPTPTKKGDASPSSEKSDTTAPVTERMTAAASPAPLAKDAASQTTNAKPQFQPLFNGEDMAGWITDPKQPGNWRVDDHVLIGSGPAPSHLYTKRDDFADFHLRVEARFNEVGSGGVYVRCPLGPKLPKDDPKWPDGFEVTINNARIARNSTGGLYPGEGDAVFITGFTTVPFGQWFTMEVIAEGPAVAVLVNGKTSAYKFDPKRLHGSGHIALQQYSPETKVEFRKIEITELNRWNQKDPKEISRFLATTDRVARVAFSSDGRGVLSGETSIEFLRKSADRGNSFHYHFDHPYAIRVWEVASGRSRFAMRGEGGFTKFLALSSNGHHAAACDGPLDERPILTWDLKTGERAHKFLPQKTAEKMSCTSLAFSPDDHRVMAALRNGTVLVWDLVTEHEQTPFTLKYGQIRPNEFPVAAFTSDRQHLVTGSRSLVELWDLQSGRVLQAFAGHTKGIRNVASSPDGRLILSVGGDDTVRLWNVGTGRELKRLKSDQGQVLCIAFSPDSRQALTADVYGLLQLWDLASGKVVCRMAGHTMAVNSVAFSPDGRRAVSGSDDRTVRLWQLPEPDGAVGLPTKIADTVARKPADKNSVPPPEIEANPSGSRVDGLPNTPRQVPTGAPKLLTNSIGAKLVLIPADKFLMGSPHSDQGDERPQHTVRITRPFYLGVTEVTQGQFRTVSGANPSEFQGSDDLPVETVSWNDGIAFCNKLSEREGLRPYYQLRASVPTDGDGYRLPTEAEWEYACRAGTTSRFSFGNDVASFGEHAWFNGNSGRRTQPVAQKRPNAFGLYDMQGNVWEWCWDGYNKDFYQQSPAVDPTGPSHASTRIHRGDGFYSGTRIASSANRGNRPAGYKNEDLGFRLARSQPDPIGMELELDPSEKKPSASPARSHLSQAGKLSSPAARRVHVDEFDGPQTGLPEDLNIPHDPGHGRSDGVYFAYSPRGWHAWPIHDIRSEGTCEIVARVLSDDPKKTATWLVIVHNKAASRGFLIKINLKGELFLQPNPWPKGEAFREVDPRLGPIVHRAIRPGYEFNKLLLVLSKREVTIFVNGVQVCPPVRFGYDIAPSTLEFGASGPGKKRAEFDRLEIGEMIQPEEAPKR